MSKKYVYTEVEGRKLKLSNLEKVLYPTVGISKAEVIQYYLKISDHLLDFIKDRPLTLIRYPDGVNEDRFYAKDKPSWTPEWVKSVRLPDSDDENDYILAQNKATFTWLANLAALELHPMQSTLLDLNRPDFWVIDLDPDEGMDFGNVKEVAWQLKEFLSQYGYTTYIKTSGGKGFHLMMPLQVKWTFEEVVETAKGLMREFISTVNSGCTLHVHKNKRKGKILLDINRNHMGNTTVAPYSLRGKQGAPISTPIKWDQLDEIESAQDYTLNNIFTFIEEHGLPWEDWRSKATGLHDQKGVHPVKGNKNETEKSGLLQSYFQKRDFERTGEPAGKIKPGQNDQFVIQLHNASNLHYDLRLEADGVLKSWAIPKGLPVRNGVKRLAIQTEDHPMQYIDYEGIIPKGEYGAGEMWVFTSGKYDLIESTEKKWEFRLKWKRGIRHYILYKTKDKQWIIERKDEPGKIMLDKPIKPMLASLQENMTQSDSHLYEVKWDGIRVIVFIEDGKVHLQSRNGNDLTDKFPELHNVDDYFEIENGIFDGEIVCLDEQGKPVFSKVISRMHTTGDHSILAATKSNPAVCYLFDVIYLDGRNITTEPLHRRQAWLKVSLKKQESYRMSEAMTDGRSLAKAAEAAGLEGVMIKNRNSTYQTGSRSRDWLKVKFRTEAEAYIIGYTSGEGDRSGLFGALHLAHKYEEEWTYMGKVGTGFSHALLESILNDLKQLKERKKYIKDTIEEEKRTIWIDPVFKCKIQYASLTSNNTYREPVFLELIKPSKK